MNIILGPNHSFNLSNRPASDYAKLYEVSKAAIRDVNPNIPVIGLNTSGAPICREDEEAVAELSTCVMRCCHITAKSGYGQMIR